MRIRAPERNARVRVQGRKGFEGGSWRDGRRWGRGKERDRGAGESVVVAGFGGRNPLRAISGRAVFRGSQNGRRPHQIPALG